MSSYPSLKMCSFSDRSLTAYHPVICVFHRPMDPSTLNATLGLKTTSCIPVRQCAVAQLPWPRNEYASALMAALSDQV